MRDSGADDREGRRRRGAEASGVGFQKIPKLRTQKVVVVSCVMALQLALVQPITPVCTPV